MALDLTNLDDIKRIAKHFKCYLQDYRMVGLTIRLVSPDTQIVQYVFSDRIKTVKQLYKIVRSSVRSIQYNRREC